MAGLDLPHYPLFECTLCKAHVCNNTGPVILTEYVRAVDQAIARREAGRRRPGYTVTSVKTC